MEMVAVGVGGILLMVITIGLCIVKYYRTGNKNINTTNNDNLQSTSSFSHAMSQLKSNSPTQTKQTLPYDPVWEVEHSNIKFKRLLGEGEFGRVSLCVVDGLPFCDGSVTAAVKMLKGKLFVIVQ